MAGTVHFTHKKQEKTVSAPGVLVVQWPDRLRLEVQDPVGSVLFLLVMNGERFWVYQKEAKENLMGPVRAWGGIPFFRFFSFVPQPKVAAFFLARPQSQGIDSDRLARQRLEGKPAALDAWRFEFGGERASIQYGEYESRGGMLYPTKILFEVVDRSGQKESVAVAWKEWEDTISSDESIFQLPPKQTFGRATKALP